MMVQRTHDEWVKLVKEKQRVISELNSEIHKIHIDSEQMKQNQIEIIANRKTIEVLKEIIISMKRMTP